MDENMKDIAKLKKLLNEAQTDSELNLKYMQQDFDGKEDCQERQFYQERTTLINRIKYLETQREKEKLVFETVSKYLEDKKSEYTQEGDRWEKKKNAELDQLSNQINTISQQKQDDEELKQKIYDNVDTEKLALELRRKKEEEKEAELERKR